VGARPEHGVLSHALTLSANGVDVGEVDEVVEDEGGRDSGERERERERENARVRERERKDRVVQGGRPGEKRREKPAGRRTGEGTGDKERRVDDEGRRR